MVRTLICILALFKKRKKRKGHDLTKESKEKERDLTKERKEKELKDEGTQKKKSARFMWNLKMCLLLASYGPHMARTFICTLFIF
jgi:hypothetical protein